MLETAEAEIFQCPVCLGDVPVADRRLDARPLTF